MFPEGIEHYIMWQCLPDMVAPVDIYLYVYMFVCGGEPRWPNSLQWPLSLIYPSLICSSCWLKCCLKCFFHGRMWRASFRLLLTGNALT